MKNKYKKWMIGLLLFLVLMAAACYTVFVQPYMEREKVTYEETDILQGNLQTKVVESGTLEYELYNITYDVDVQVTQEEAEDDEEWTQKYLEIEEIYVAAGKKVKAGEALLKFSDSSVESVRKLLKKALLSAETDYNEAESEYQLAVLEAESEYQLLKINGKYAESVYKEADSQISADITVKELELADYMEKVSELEAVLEEAQENYRESKKEYEKIYASYMNDYNSTEHASNFMVAQNHYINARTSMERAESTWKQAEENLTKNQENIRQLQQDIVLAKARYVIDVLSVDNTYSQNKMYAENAQFSLDATLEELQEDLEEAAEEKNTLEEKLEAFEQLVGEEGILYATEEGLITSVLFHAGDTLERVGTILTYTTDESMRIAVDVTQEDVVTLQVGDAVSILFSAYEDAYTGYIESIDTTATSADTPTVSYQVIVHVVGSTDTLLDGMTANVSFVTETREDTVYVLRKALIEGNGKTYLCVKTGLSGKELIEVETGIRNEEYVEILSEIDPESTIYITTQSYEEATDYKEVTVEYGSLVVGVEESGSVDIGVIEQVFELDMSALQRVETSNNASGMSMGGGLQENKSMGLDMFSQMFQMSGNAVANSGIASASELKIAEVCVSVGQTVKKGDVLYRLEADGVEELSEELKGNVNKAETDLKALQADQALSKMSAENTYKTSIAYGSYAETEKNSTISNLEQTVEAKKKSLETVQTSIAAVYEQLEQAEYDYKLALENLENCKWGVSHTDKEDIFAYTSAFEQLQQAQTLFDTMEQKLEEAEKDAEQAEKNLTNSQNELSKAERALESGRLDAQETYELRMLAYANAQETYELTLTYLEEDLEEQQDIFDQAKEKWDAFSSHINGTEVCAKFDGVITSVELSEGDLLVTGATVVKLYDTSEVTMTVTLDEDDMSDIAEEGMANISFTAYPDSIYQAVITDISDASANKNGTTYDVTVTLQGDVTGLFQGMTGKVTFITKQMQNVVYVSNRAITRDGLKSYVKIKDESGNVKTKEVVTGFSDGVNVEIIEGLEAGEVVLIESKVTEK